MLVRKGLRKGKYMSGGCQFFTQIQPDTPAGREASGAGGKKRAAGESIGPLLCDRGAKGMTAGAVYV